MKLIQALNLSSGPQQLDVISFVGAGGKSTTMFRLATELAAQGERVITTTTTRIAAEQIRQSPAFVTVSGSRLPLDAIKRALDSHGQCLLIGRESAERRAGEDEAGKKAGIEPDVIDTLATHAGALGLSAILVEADGSRMLPAKAPAGHEPAMPQSTTLVVPVVGMDALGLPIVDPYVHRPQIIRRLLKLQPDPALCVSPDRLTPAHVRRLLLHPEGGSKGVPSGARLLPLLNQADSGPKLALARLIALQLSYRQQPALIAAVGKQPDDPIIERWGPGALIVLAAGGSSRMGRPKQLIRVDGESMIVRAMKIALQSHASEIVVVTGAYVEEVRRELASLYLAQPERVRLVHNPDWQSGQTSSIHAAVQALSSSTEAAIFMPADQPFLQPQLLRLLQRCWQMGARFAAPVVEGEVRGAPALFDRSTWPDLLDLRGDTGGRSLLRRYAAEVTGVPAEASMLRDIDRPQDHHQSSEG